MIDLLLNGVIQGVLGARPKRSKNALRYLTGRRGGGLLTHPQTLLTAAGLAWGVFETLQQSPRTDPSASAPPPASLPPLPDAAAPAPAAAPEVLRLVRLVISAANADGAIGERERAAIAAQAGATGASALEAAELSHPRPLAEIVSGVIDPAERATLYVLAYTVLRADEQVSGAERIYLAQLAHLLGLEPQRVQELEKGADDRITRSGEDS